MIDGETAFYKDMQMEYATRLLELKQVAFDPNADPKDKALARKLILEHKVHEHYTANLYHKRISIGYKVPK